MLEEETLKLKGDEDDDEEMICLDSSFFVDRSYELTEFTFGSNSLQLLCLRSASTDYDLTGQLVWPGAVLMNNYLSSHAQILSDKSVIELGSGVGITGMLCSRFCRDVVLTDHNDEVLEARFKHSSICFPTPHFIKTASCLSFPSRETFLLILTLAWQNPFSSLLVHYSQ